MDETVESIATGADTQAAEEAPIGAEPGNNGEAPPTVTESAGSEPVPGEGIGVESESVSAAPVGDRAAEPVEPLELPAENAPAPEGAAALTDEQLKAILEAIVYVAEEPVTAAQIGVATGQPETRVRELLDQLAAEFNDPAHGVMIREVAGGYKMATKPEHHEAVRAFAKSLKPPLKLSLAALETLATIAYKQPITAPEIMEIRGVQGAGVLKTLLDRKLIQTAGRKNVVGRPILYRTTRDFLVQFGLKDLSELPTLKEFEELRRLAINGDEEPAPSEAPPADSEAGNA